jgi:hypothetical protein
MKPYERKWWFLTPVGALTIGSTFWLFVAVGLGSPASTISFARVVLFFLVVHSFQRLFTHLLWVVLLWVSPSSIGDKKVTS